MFIPLIALALLAPADTEPTPIDQNMLELILATGGPEIDNVCASYIGIQGAVDQLNLDPETEVFFTDMVDAYLVSMLEGDTLQLSPEASDTFVVFLHGCGV